jgi:pilus assembly protein CpaF
MSLRDRLQKATQQSQPLGGTLGQSSASPGASGAGLPAMGAAQRIEVPVPKSQQFEVLKTKIHNKLVDSLDITKTEALGKEEVLTATNQFLEQFLVAERIPMSRQDREILVRELVEEILGLGPLEPLLRDPTVSDILVNGPYNVYVERFGKL